MGELISQVTDLPTGHPNPNVDLSDFNYDFRNKRFLAEDNTKFGVNTLLYVLTT